MLNRGKVSRLLGAIGIGIFALGSLGEAKWKPPIDPQQYEGFRLELHWGMVDRLGYRTDNRPLFLPMNGRIVIGGGDPRQGAIHLISALLFESDGEYQAGRGDRVLPREDYTPIIAWQSATTDDWDGIAVAIHWPRGTNPPVRIETDQWSIELPARDLRTFQKVIPIGRDGQALEVGRFFTLRYKVYDLALQWGSGHDEEGRPIHPLPYDLSGRVDLSQGGIRAVGPLRPGGSGVRQPADLTSSLEFSYAATDGQGLTRRATQGIGLNLIVPQGVKPMVRVALSGGEVREFTLPEHFQSLHHEIPLDPQGNFVHAHLHWCWFKTPHPMKSSGLRQL